MLVSEQVSSLRLRALAKRWRRRLALVSASALGASFLVAVPLAAPAQAAVVFNSVTPNVAAYNSNAQVIISAQDPEFITSVLFDDSVALIDDSSPIDDTIAVRVPSWSPAGSTGGQTVDIRLNFSGGAVIGTNVFTVYGAVSQVDLQPSSFTVESTQSQLLTATLKDSSGNTVLTPSSTITFSNTGSPGSVTLGNITTPTSVDGVATLTVTGFRSGDDTVTASAGSGIDDTSAVTVLSDPTIQSITLEAPDGLSSGTVTAGQPIVLTATLFDLNGNTVTNSGASVTLTNSSPPGATSPATITLPSLPLAAGTGVIPFTVTGANTGFLWDDSEANEGGQIFVAAQASGKSSGSVTLTVVPDDVVASIRVVNDRNSNSSFDLVSGDDTQIYAVLQDSLGNQVTSLTTQNGGVTITNAGSGNPQGSVTATNGGVTDAIAGLASITVTGNRAGNVTASASYLAVSSTNSGSDLVYTVTSSGTVASISLTSDNSQVTAGDTRVLTATLLDSNGNRVTGGGPVTLTNTGTPDSLIIVSPGAASNGIATFTVTGNKVGTADLFASFDSLTSGNDSPVAIAVSASNEPASIELTGLNTDLSSGQSRVLTATLLDAGGNPIASGYTGSVTFTQTNVLGGSVTSFPALDTATSNSGLSQINITVTGVRSGYVGLRAEVAAAAGPNANSLTTSNLIQFDITPGVPSQVYLTGPNAALTSGDTQVLTATLQDAAGNTVTGVNSQQAELTQINAGVTVGSVTGLNQLVTFDATSGTATFTITGNKSGLVQLQAERPGTLTGVNTLNVNVTASNQVARVAVTGDTTDLTSGQPRVLTATLYDLNDNVVENSGGTGPLTFTNSGAADALVAGVPASVLTDRVVDAVDGVAVITVTGSKAGTAQVGASFGPTSSNSDDSVTFSVVAADEISRIVLDYSTADLTAGTTRLVTATLQDFGGNTVLTNANVAFSNSASSVPVGTATGLNFAPNSVNADNGVATITITGLLTGNVLPVATVGAITGTNTPFLVVSNVGVAANSELTATNTQLFVDDTTSVTVLVRDAYGNLVTREADASVVMSTTLGSLTPPNPVFTTPGSYSRELSAGSFLGTATISATVNGSPISSLPIQIVAGPVTSIELTGTNLDNVGAGATRVLTATLKDAQDRVVTTSTASVTLQKVVNSGNGTLLDLPQFETASSGIATFTVTGGLVGSLDVQAVSFGVSASNSVGVTVTNGTAVSLDLTGSNASLSSGQSRVLTATLLDGGGNPVSGTVTFANSEPFATLSVTQVNSGGTVSVTGAEEGNAVIQAYSDALDDSLTIPVTFGAAAQLTLTGAVDTLTAGQARVVTATVRDAYGNQVANATTTVTLTNAGSPAGSLIGVPSITNAVAGLATFTVTGGLAGQASLTASANSLTSGGLATFTVVADDTVAGIQITGSNADLTAGSTRVVTASLVDAGGNPFTSGTPLPVTFTNVYSGNVQGSVGGVPTSGLQINDSVAITVTGVNSGGIGLVASAESNGTVLTTDDTAPSSGPLVFFVNAASAQALTFINQPAAVQNAGATLTGGNGAAIQVQALDEFGNPATVTGTLSLTASNSVALQGVTSVTGTFSSVTFSNLSITQAASGITLGASFTGLTGTGSTLFDVVPGPAAQLSFVNQPSPSSVTVGNSFTATVEIQDAYGNKTADDSVITLTIAPSGTLSGGVSTANDGEAVFPSLSTVNAGTKQLIASVSGLPSQTSANIVVNPDAFSVATTTVTASNLGPIQATADDSTLITVETKDQYGNPTSTGVTSVSLLASSPGALLGTLAGSGGVYTQYLRGTGTGTSTVEARVNSSIVDDSVRVAFVAPATQISLTTSNANLTSGQARVVTATIQDANGNTVVSSAAIALTSANSGVGSILPVDPISASAGVAVFTVTGHIAGAVNLAASASGPSITGSLASAFTVVPGSASLATSTVSASPTSIPADGSTQAFITVQLKDSAGNSLTSNAGTVTLTNSGAGTLVNGGATTYVNNGFYTGYITAPATQGSATVSGYLDGQLITPSTATVTFTATPPPPPPPPPTPTVPGAPTIGTAIAGDGQATVVWTAPSSTGGAAITGYRIEQSTNGGTSWTVAVANTASTSTSQVVTGLTNGTAYVFRVAAINTVGTGPNSATSNSVTPSRSVPGAPTSVTAVAGNAEAIVGWVAPTFTGGSAIAGYRIEQQRGSGEWTVAVANTGSTTTNAVVTGLTNGESYRFRVAAINASGTGDNSEPSNAVTPEAPLGKSILIVGERAEVRGKPGVVITGESTGFTAGSIFKPWFRFPGQTSFTEGSANITVASDGTFKWQRQTGKKLYVYVQAGDGTRSNRVIIPAN